MTRALAITERQVTALCQGAKKAGYKPIVEINKVFVHLVPEDHDIRPQEVPEVDRAGKGHF